MMRSEGIVITLITSLCGVITLIVKKSRCQLSGDHCFYIRSFSITVGSRRLNSEDETPMIKSKTLPNRFPSDFGSISEGIRGFFMNDSTMVKFKSN